MRTHPRLALVASVLCLWFTLGCGGDPNVHTNPPDPQPVTQGQSWTVLVYMVADNELEPFAVDDLLEMVKVSTQSRFQIVVQVDRAVGFSNAPVANLPDWTTAKRLLVSNGGFVEQGDLGEVDMGDPAVLSDFIQWGITNHPADRYALMFWDHGASWPGFGGDASTPDLDFLTLNELQQGVADGLQRAGTSKFELIGFDACLMSGWEVAEALKPYAEFLLASEELEPGHGWDWSALRAGASDPGIDAVGLGKAIGNGYVAQATQEGTERNLTLSLTQLSALDTLEQGVKALAAEGAKDLPGDVTLVARAVDQSLGFNRSPDPSLSSNVVDLGDFAGQLAAGDPRFTAARDQLAAGLQKAVVFKVDGPVTSAATGLSIYFPRFAPVYDPQYDTLAEVADWRDFLKSYLAQTAGPPPTFTNAGKVADTTLNNGQITATGTLAAGASLNIAQAQLLFGLRLQSGETVIAGDRPATYDDTTVQGTWDLTVLSVSQGSTMGFAYLSVDQSTQNELSLLIPFAYSVGGSEPQYVIRDLILDATGKPVQDTYFLQTSAGVGQLSPEPGSTLQPLVQVIDTQGNVTWAAGGDPMDATQPIALGMSMLNSGTDAFVALSIIGPSGDGDAVTALVTVP